MIGGTYLKKFRGVTGTGGTKGHRLGESRGGKETERLSYDKIGDVGRSW